MAKEAYRNTLHESQNIICSAMEHIDAGLKGFSTAYFTVDVASIGYSSVERGKALYSLEKVFKRMSDSDYSIEILRQAFNNLQMLRWISE
jgi:hypothetical protein